MDQIFALTNAIVYTGYETLRKQAVLVKNGLIEKLVAENDIPDNYPVRDLKGLNLAPAFIDLQIYGAMGKLFSSNTTVETIAATYEYCLKGGCSHFMITLATNSIEVFLQGIEVVHDYWNAGGKGLLGLHLEGPYLNPVKRGAHTLAHIKKATLAEVKLLLQHRKGVVKMMTVAPELMDPDILQYLLQEKIIVSAGHSNATYTEAMAGFNAGIPAATHLFNAMSPFQSREPGLVGAAYNHPVVRSSIVPDGIHVDFAALKISKKLMGDRLFFITDAVTINSKGGYEHVFKGDRYTLPDGTLSGSALNMMQCVHNAITFADISLEEALRMASTYPAQLLKNSIPMGRIAPGYLANLVVFAENFDIKEVITP